ncbi:hypothetical protein DESC_480087 [Desulfosarcina cetonica]|nr:hypothetical protein DESC_480087 [Desulfosarcina cetonica]
MARSPQGMDLYPDRANPFGRGLELDLEGRPVTIFSDAAALDVEDGLILRGDEQPKGLLDQERRVGVEDSGARGIDAVDQTVGVQGDQAGGNPAQKVGGLRQAPLRLFPLGEQDLVAQLQLGVAAGQIRNGVCWGMVVGFGGGHAGFPGGL